MLFSAELSDFRVVLNVLRCMAFKDYVIVRPTEEGLKLTLEEMTNVEMSAYVPRNMFSHYKVNTEELIIFKISMKILIECLGIFGEEGNPNVKLSYKELGEPLCLIITHSDEDVTVDCEIRTLDVDRTPEISLSEECNSNKVVLSAKVLVEILQRLDNAADELTLSIDNEPPYLAFSATGVAGESKVTMSKHSDAITIFQCKEKCSWKYAFYNIRQVLKVMNCASKVAIFTGDSGLLGLQLVINFDEKLLYVEFYVTTLFLDE